MKQHKRASGLSHEAKLIEKILAEETDPADECQWLPFNFEVCIDIGDGRKGILKIDERSDALDCALQFCRNYELDEVIAGILCQSIKEKIDNERKSVLKAATAEKRSRNSMSQSGEWERDRSYHARQEERALHDITSGKMSNSMSVVPTKQKNRTQSQQGTTVREQQEELVSRPKINQISRIIVDKLQKKSIVEEVEVNRRRKETKVERMKKELERKEFAQCSFKPKINPISQKVDSEIQRETSCLSHKRYEQLYQQSFVIEGKKEHERNKSIENMRFKPEINQISRSIVAGMTFEQRQERFKQNKREPAQISGVPKTGRRPHSRNVSGMPIGDYLYSKAKKSQQRASVVIMRPSEHPKLATLDRSECIVNHLKETRLREIFDVLDFNKDGIIRYEQIEEDCLDQQTMEIFLPILEEMRQLDIQLDESQFLQAADRLFETLTMQERSLILNTRKRADPAEEYSFKVQVPLMQPQINKKYLNSSQCTQDLYTRSLQDKKKLRDKVEREKEEQARAELTQCTFKPKIIRYSNPLYSNLN